MAVLKILQCPDQRLKQVSKTVTVFDDALRGFIADLEETMRAGPGGVGIAAPQVGRLKRIALVDLSGARKPQPNHRFLILVNPEINSWEGMRVGREGCMSVPDYTGNVIRAEKINLTALDADGIERQFESEGFEARAIQHELDHLDGILFLDRLVSRNKDLFRRKL